VELGNHGPDPIKSLLLAAQHDSHSNVRDAATFALNSSLSPSEAAPQVAILDAVSLGEAAQPCATWPRVMMRYCLIFAADSSDSQKYLDKYVAAFARMGHPVLARSISVQR